MIEEFVFECPTPPSKKNRRQAHMPNFEALRAQKVLEEHLNVLMAQRKLEAPIWPDEDIEIVQMYYPRETKSVVTVRAIGDKPRHYTGRRRDIVNTWDVICDALQRRVFSNDNQIADARVIRCL